MKRPRYIDFVCEVCNHAEERFVETNDDGTPCEPQTCAQQVTYSYFTEGAERAEKGKTATASATCEGAMHARDELSSSVQTIVKGNHDYAQRERERLEKRSTEHYKKKGYAEKMDRMRMLDKKAGL